MIIDCHVHLVSEEGYAGKLVAEMDRLGISACCLLAMQNIPFWGSRAASNEQVIAACRAYPGRFIPFGYVDLGVDPIGLIDQLAMQGFKGLKVTRTRYAYNDDRLMDYYARAAAYGMVMLFHTGTVVRVAEDQYYDVDSEPAAPDFPRPDRTRVPDAHPDRRAPRQPVVRGSGDDAVLEPERLLRPLRHAAQAQGRGLVQRSAVVDARAHGEARPRSGLALRAEPSLRSHLLRYRRAHQRDGLLHRGVHEALRRPAAAGRAARPGHGRQRGAHVRPGRRVSGVSTPDSRAERKRETIRAAWLRANGSRVPFFIEAGENVKATRLLLSDPARDLACQEALLAAAATVDDDSLPSLKPNLGIGVMATAFGCPHVLDETNDPWVKPLIDDANPGDALPSRCLTRSATGCSRSPWSASTSSVPTAAIPCAA